MLIDYTQSLTNADILGQGNLYLVSEKSGKSQGILLSIICGNPVFALCYLFACNSKTLRYILIIPCRDVNPDE